MEFISYPTKIWYVYVYNYICVYTIIWNIHLRQYCISTYKIFWGELPNHWFREDHLTPCTSITSQAYDLTKFAKVHPGGAKLITDAAGMDATAIFDPIHPKVGGPMGSLCRSTPEVVGLRMGLSGFTTLRFCPRSPCVEDIMDKLLKPSLTMGVVDVATIKPEHVAKAPEAWCRAGDRHHERYRGCRLATYRGRSAVGWQHTGLGVL